jgi:two-component sensor histidine kinase
VYDAFGKDKEKTISLFKEAAQLFHSIDGQFEREYYIRHLIAHAYDKTNDSVRCVQQLSEIYDTILTKSDSLRQRMNYIPQMAFISTVVKNYDIAENILLNLYQRNWIKNDPRSYNYEDFYFLTRLKIDVYKYKKYNSTYRDSFLLALQQINNPIDSLYYLNELMNVLGDAQQYKTAYELSKVHNALNAKILDSETVGSLQNKLLNLELQNQRKKLDEDAKDHNNRNIIMVILTLGLLLTTFLGWRLYRISQQYKQQKNDLATINNQLDVKVKEIQHRVKNNLHLIFSLLNMQERRSENPDTIENLQKARLRIESIAGLHDQLNQNNDQYVDFDLYIHKLIQTIINCIETDHKIIANTNIGMIDVPNHYYVPIGLILNEWITNSIKYAQTDASLVLNIKMQQDNNIVTIVYADNGKPETQHQIKGSGLGSEIITLLTRQIKGTLSTSPDNIFRYQLTIQIPDGSKN